MAQELRLDPIKIDDNNWYYEEKRGVCFMHRVCKEHTGEYLQTDQIIIPWKRLLESVNRKYGRG